MDTDTELSATTSRSDALSRATALANRARDLRRAQVEVQDLTSREVQVMARTAASFFDAIPLPEFTSSLLPLAARQLRRMRHRILHRTVHTTASGTMIHAMLLGRDGVLRLFSARTADSRDLLLSLEPGRPLPPSVVRDVVEWTPTLRVSGFRPFEILEKLSGSLDAVEEQIADAEEKVQVQKQALATGDLTALLPGRVDRGGRAALSAGPIVTERGAGVQAREVDVALDALRSIDSIDMIEPTAPVNAAPPVLPAPIAALPSAESSNPFDIFEAVEAVAASARVRTPPHAARDDVPAEWDEPELPSTSKVAASRNSLFPVLPPQR
jgi:hypothetical protein